VQISKLHLNQSYIFAFLKSFLIKYFILAIVLLGLFSCCPTKYVLEDEYLLDSNKILFAEDSIGGKNHGRQISIDDLYPILKQKPNRKIGFGLARLHLRIYSLSNEERIQKRKLVYKNKADKKNLKIDQKNIKRRAKDKLPKQYKVVKTTFGEGLRNSGEAPVILDSLKIHKSIKQLNNQLINEGYFNSQINYRVSFEKHQKAEVSYIISEGKPYTIKQINNQINDSLLLSYINSISQDSYLKVGENFNTDKMDFERSRLTKYLLDNGFHFFNKEFIYFRIDSTLGSRQVNVVLGIQNYKIKDVMTDSIVEVKHRQYEIKEVIVVVDYDAKDDVDSITQGYQKETFEEIDFFHKKKLRYHLKMLHDAVLIKEGELYNKTIIEATYRKFSGLGIFKSVSVQFDTLNDGLQARIFLEPIKAQTFNVSSDGLHNNGLYGIEGSMTYAHKNVFGGAERLQISFSGGLEAQKLLIDNESDDNLLSNANFNTIEFGPRISLVFPRFLFLNKYFTNKANAKTELSTSYNYQKRPDFTRGVQDISMTWVWHEKAPITYKFTPISVSAINITKEQAFQDKIDALNDEFLAASYDNHIIAGGRLSFEYNGQQLKKSKNVFYTSTTIEGAGNVLRGVYKYSNQVIDTITNSYSLFGIRFAQFVKINMDTRYYRLLSKKTKVVYRVAAGIGLPLSNLSEALPFQKSFFSGGANGMRAWKARTLGPGAYYDSTGSFDKIGDIQLESNIEFRFPLISWVEGALFVDAGNIWLINRDSLRTDAHFETDRFISEIAIGTGVGLRMDLDFFVIRFDLSMPFRNPSLPSSQRWLFQGGLKEGSSYFQTIYDTEIEQYVEAEIDRGQFFKLQFNLGIGYPF
jgi:outer membrane protein assembly factor BamA